MGSGHLHGKKSRLCVQNPAILCILGRKMVRSAVYNVFLNTLTVEIRSHAFWQLFNNGKGVPKRSPAKRIMKSMHRKIRRFS